MLEYHLLEEISKLKLKRRYINYETVMNSSYKWQVRIAIKKRIDEARKHES